MNNRQLREHIIDQELVDDLKDDDKDILKYTEEVRIAIFLLRKFNHLTYRQIIEYCQRKYDISPALGHIKKLIEDGELAFNNQNATNPSQNSRIFKKEDEDTIDRKEETIIENSAYNLKDRFMELSSKLDELTLAELWELFGLYVLSLSR